MWNSKNVFVKYLFSSVVPLYFHIIYISFLRCSETVHSVRRPLYDILYQPRIIDDECGAGGGMRIGKGDHSTRRKPAPVPLCPPQIPHDLTPSSNAGRLRGEPAAVVMLCYSSTYLAHSLQLPTLSNFATVREKPTSVFSIPEQRKAIST
jgi:hypothetical protein